MDSPENSRAKARRFLRMASDVTDPWAANLLRLAAADCFDLAEKAEGKPVQVQQQQQPQPKQPTDK
jgi:hypothetical protein